MDHRSRGGVPISVWLCHSPIDASAVNPRLHPEYRYVGVLWTGHLPCDVALVVVVIDPVTDAVVLVALADRSHLYLYSGVRAAWPSCQPAPLAVRPQCLQSLAQFCRTAFGLTRLWCVVCLPPKPLFPCLVPLSSSYCCPICHPHATTGRLEVSSTSVCALSSLSV